MVSKMKNSSKKLKIGIVMDTTLDSNDGVQQYVKALGRWLIKNGHDVRFLVGKTENSGEFEGRIINIGKNINIHSNGNNLSPAVFPNLKEINKIIREEKFDIFHLQMPYSPTVSAVLLERTNVPIVATFHILPNSSIITFLNHIFSFLLGRQIKKFKKVIAVSSSAKEFFDKIYKKESIVIPNMVDLKKFKTTDKIEKYSDSINILFLGRLVERKGAAYLLEAMQSIQEKLEGVSYKVLIAGDGYQKNQLMNFVKTNNLRNIEFLGFIDESDKSKIYNTADICVFPAVGGESFGIVLIEAMAAGKAVLAFDNPGYSSVMRDHAQECLVENKNSKDLGDKIYELVKDKNKRESLGKTNKIEVEKYTVENVCKRIMDVYLEAIG